MDTELNTKMVKAKVEYENVKVQLRKYKFSGVNDSKNVNTIINDAIDQFQFCIH